MASDTVRFGRFLLDAGDRRLHRDGQPVELNSRYFDALALLIGEQGRLVSKDRFLDEVWRGVPVTDEALTQCIKTLRRQLEDDAANPRFIETVPKHGYRFIAAVDNGDIAPLAQPSLSAVDWQPLLWRTLAGTVGGAIAGLAGGVVYGFFGASQPLAPGMSAISVVLVIALACIAMATLGAGGVSLGMALTRALPGRGAVAAMFGAAAGGLLVGAVVKLVGLDALNLMFGHAPADITGAGEGVVLGAAIGLGVWLARRSPNIEQAMAWGGIACGSAGAAVALAGGQMMAGSLERLAQAFPGSRIALDPIGQLFGESGFGPVSRVATGGFEGLLFGACVVGALAFAERRLAR